MAKKSKWTPEQLQEILSKPFDIFPEPSDEAKAKGITKRGPSPWQRQLFMWEYPLADRLAGKDNMHVHNKDIVLAYGGRGGGKCLGLDTPILMFDGSIKMVQNVVVGDLLMGPDSKPRKVLSLARGREEMFKVTTKVGKESFVCNRSHILSLKLCNAHNHSIKTIQNISIDEYLDLPKSIKKRLYLYKSPTIKFSRRNKLPIDPYFLGLWLADGNHKQPVITNIDPEIENYLKDFAESQGMYVQRTDLHLRLSHKIWQPRNEILNKLKELGVYGNKHIPAIYLTASLEDRFKLLAGLLDGDGEFTNHGFVFSQKRERLTDDVVFLIKSLGIRVSKRGPVKKDNCFYLQISGPEISKIPTLIKRKTTNNHNSDSRIDFLVTGFKLESLGEGDYYGFELEGPDRLFLLGDFTVTHNTIVNTALNMFFLTQFPGCETVCGANTYNDIQEIVYPKFKALLSINEDWDHPWVVSTPSTHNKKLILEIPTWDEESGTWIKKTSTAHFTHFSDVDRLLGKQYVYVGLEEMSQLKEERILDELERSLRSPLSPFRMMYAATNPPESMSHFMYRRWDLTKYMPDYDGEEPEKVICKCQFCQECLNNNLGDFPYDENDLCTNPNCAFKNLCRQYGLPITPARRPIYKYDFGHKSIKGKTLCCPGSQSFRRVLHSTALDNPFLPSSQMQDLKASQDEANFAVFAMGEVRALRSNKVYPAYSFGFNTYSREPYLADPAKDIIWSHDHNVRPRCSVVIQEERQADNNDIVANVINEIVMYDTKEPKFYTDPERAGERIRGVGPEHVAEKFINLYKGWNDESIKRGEQKTVLIYGDHTALNSKMSPFSANEFQIFRDMLVAAGFKAVVMIRKIKGKTQVTQEDRLTLTNWMLRDNKGKVRIKINRSYCKHLIKSLEDLERDKVTRSSIDKSCDESAAKSTNTNIVHLISHVSDALGYYLIRCFNLTEQDGVINFAYIAGGSAVTIDFQKGTLRELNPQPEMETLPRKTQEQLDAEYQQSFIEDLTKALRVSAGEDFDPLGNFIDHFGI